MSSSRLNCLIERAALLLPVLLLSFGFANAQGGVGSTRGLPDSASGIHTIQGHVFLPSGRRAAEGIMVRLEGNVVGTRRASTGGDGDFMFNQLPAAEYTITVDGGGEFEKVTQQVVIYGNTGNVGAMRSGQNIQLDIHLVPKGSIAYEGRQFAGVPKEALDSYKKGMQLAQSDPNKAADQFKRAISLHPDFGPALYQLGVQYLKLGQADKAAEVLGAAVKAAPDEFEPRLKYGFALLNLKKYVDAEEQLRVVLKKNSAVALGHLYLGMTLAIQRKLEEGEKELRTAIELNATETGSAHKYLAGIYIERHEYNRAADELDAYLKLTPKAADVERTRAAIKDLRAKQ